MLGFRISSFGWGAGHLNLLKKIRQRHTRHIQAFGMDNWPINIDNKGQLHQNISVGSETLKFFTYYIDFSNCLLKTTMKLI